MIQEENDRVLGQVVPGLNADVIPLIVIGSFSMARYSISVSFKTAQTISSPYGAMRFGPLGPTPFRDGR